jgi:hypothetical protein
MARDDISSDVDRSQGHTAEQVMAEVEIFCNDRAEPKAKAPASFEVCL